jgi:adenosylcobinamide kinase/adenosylcobinamide-phosphate guanylyltransferase
VRSGKSRYAVAEARRAGARVGFVATARPSDPEMRARIARHQAERPREWVTIQEPVEVVLACRRLARQVDVIVVDCLTLWVSNLLADSRDDHAIAGAAEALAKLLGERLASVTLVSNEVGWGVHPSTSIGIRFRDALGSANQCIAAAADRVTLMVAGLPITIKHVSPAPDVRSDDRSPEAP